ncbi:MAG TPA: hypothetical protein VHG70_16780 [Nocardioidaceae bacterium]|nr:hypothetical protein [Nocardioidaceae bacterium]
MFGLSGRVVPTTRSSRSIGLTRSATDPDLLAGWLRRIGAETTLSQLLQDLDRSARPARLRWRPTAAALQWDEEDSHTRAWVPQGITTSADAGSSGTVHGRRVLLTSWYSPRVAGQTEGARVTFVDVTDPSSPRYRHVLLVEPGWDTGAPTTLPVPVHAGGVVWYGDLLYVAGTYTGLRVFHLDDLVCVDPAEHGGHRYLLPQRWAYRPTGDPAGRMRYSFVSVDRTSTPACLVAGEYARSRAATQIARFALDEPRGHLHGDDDHPCVPVAAFGLEVPRMQGVACVDGTYFVTSSRSRFLRGDLWVGSASRGFRRHLMALPRGPEDLSAWSAQGRLWSLTEWAGHRVVFALRADDWLPS